MSITINPDKGTLLGFGKDVLNNIGKELFAFIKSKEGIALITGLFSGTGIGVAASTKKGRDATIKAWNTIKAELAKVPKSKLASGAKALAKGIAVKAATGVATVGTAIVAGYISGLTIGDYFKGDAKNFWKQFGEDLALNLAAGPIASAVKHVVANKDMVAEDINKNVIKPISNALKAIGTKLGIYKDDASKANASSRSLATVHTSTDIDAVGGKEQNTVVTPQESGRQVVEHEKNKKGYQTPLKTTSDKMVEFMKTKQPKFNDKSWYFRGLARHMLGTTLTWSGVKSMVTGYPVVATAILHVDLTFPTDVNKLLHPQVISNTNIEWQALRGKNTGAFNYGEEEVFKYDWTLMSLIAVFRFTRKLLSLSNNHDPEVDHLPQMLYAGFANNLQTFVNTGNAYYQDVISNKALYCTQLNAIGKDINSYALKERTLISRWNYLADKCLKDFNGKKAVYGYYALRYVPSLDSNGDLVYTDLETMTIPQLLAYMQSQLDNLRTVTSGSYPAGVLLKVAGDMIKLLGANRETFDNVPYISGTETYAFEYDAEAFDQIRNAKMFPWGCTDTPSYDRTSRPQKIVVGVRPDSGTGAISPTNCYLFDQEYMLTSDRKVEFDAQENIQMVQFYCNAESSAATGGFDATVTDCGTSLLDHMSITIYNPSTGDPEVDNYCGIVTQSTNNTGLQVKLHGLIPTLHGSAANGFVGWLQHIGQIDFMPRYQIYECTSSAGTAYSVIMDVDNYAFMTAKQYAQLNNVAVYSQTFVFNPEDVKILGILS